MPLKQWEIWPIEAIRGTAGESTVVSGFLRTTDWIAIEGNSRRRHTIAIITLLKEHGSSACSHFNAQRDLQKDRCRCDLLLQFFDLCIKRNFHGAILWTDRNGVKEGVRVPFSAHS